MTRELDLPLVAYRGWQLAPLEAVEPWLSGYYRAEAKWSRGDTTGECEGCSLCPGKTCGCGLHGYCKMPYIWGASDWRTHRAVNETFFYSPHIVFGAALLWGRTRVGTQTGVIRAEYGRVIALLSMGPEAHRAAEFYDVPVINDDQILRSYACEHGQEIPIPKAPA